MHLKEPLHGRNTTRQSPYNNLSILLTITKQYLQTN